ncbi:ABC transporter ATP-binding protein [Actinacidiphila sp. DG2A-62]|uniref:ABC transporter ATP-binding protein n=1 Tax=Actinacidiphila sp. DG2A-62 TaxID=3108821 RepID=UPI002DB678B2|nr:ABC transporter ATP-binding protein [Actinacidiphila sp. DG2A-62]MEC3998168.1 ABC transporter ATP-binding protein [Actinacidiphila sp. DG2A-62]
MTARPAAGDGGEGGAEPVREPVRESGRGREDRARRPRGRVRAAGAASAGTPAAQPAADPAAHTARTGPRVRAAARESARKPADDFAKDPADAFADNFADNSANTPANARARGARGDGAHPHDAHPHDARAHDTRTPAASPVLQVSGLAKRYGDVDALAGFDLTVRPGEIVGLVGHNGAGKTTFVEVVSGLIRADAGTALVDGADPVAARGVIGVSPQHIALYPSVTVREHLRLFGGLSGLRRGALRAAVDEVADDLRLTEFLDRPAGVLSGGQQRRAQAGVALIHRPRLLLLDEPTAGADPETRQALLDAVRRRAAEGAGVVYTTHYLAELTELDATIAVAKRGRVVARGTAAELLAGLPGEVALTFADGSEQRRSTDDPTAALIRLLAEATQPVTSVDVRKPDLDDLYRSLAVLDEA